MFRGIHLIPAGTKINFMRFHKLLFCLSVIMTVGSFILVFTKGLNYGIDFAGGLLLEVRTSTAEDLAQMREKFTNLNMGEVTLQQFGSPQDILIRLPIQHEDENQTQLIDKVKNILGDTVEIRRTEYVGPKVGGELIQTATLATFLALVGIAIYIWFRYEWQFAINAILATFHDCITIVGLFSLTGMEFNLNTVAAILTIAGFSVNDTVVLYDRVRDELKRYKTMPLYDLINLAINHTLSRTIMTSGLTLLSVIALYIFGGEVLYGFSIALIWGIIIGTYSSICVATPLLLYMRLRPNTFIKEKENQSQLST